MGTHGLVAGTVWYIDPWWLVRRLVPHCRLCRLGCHHCGDALPLVLLPPALVIPRRIEVSPQLGEDILLSDESLSRLRPAFRVRRQLQQDVLLAVCKLPRHIARSLPSAVLIAFNQSLMPSGIASPIVGSPRKMPGRLLDFVVEKSDEWVGR